MPLNSFLNHPIFFPPNFPFFIVKMSDQNQKCFFLDYVRIFYYYNTNIRYCMSKPHISLGNKKKLFLRTELPCDRHSVVIFFPFFFLSGYGIIYTVGKMPWHDYAGIQ